MTHREVLSKLKDFYPVNKESIIRWFPNGDSSIRVRLANGAEVIFTYMSPHKWRLESSNAFTYGFEKKGRR